MPWSEIRPVLYFAVALYAVVIGWTVYQRQGSKSFASHTEPTRQASVP